MTALKRNGWLFFALLVLQILWPGSPRSQVPASPAFKEEMSRQNAIYKDQGGRVTEGYVINRALLAYADALSPEFDRSLANLGPDGRWLDVGAGEGHAILDYYTAKYDETHEAGRSRRGSKASAVALSIEDRRTARWHQTAGLLGGKKLQYFHGRSFREYSAQELGRFQVITDMLGGFSYTAYLDQYMERAMEVLDVGGNLYTVLQDVHSADGRNKPYYANSPYLTELTNADGSELKVCSWLKSISCVQVSCELKADWKPPIEVYHVQKVCNAVKVPALERLHFVAGTPPERRFRLKDMGRRESEAAR
jgi:hypothetical protein